MKAVYSILILTWLCLPSFGQVDTILAIAKQNTSLRSLLEDSEYGKIVAIPKGSIVKIIGEKQGSLKGVYSGRFGYISYTDLEQNDAIEKLISNAANSQQKSQPTYKSSPSAKSGSDCPTVQCIANTQMGARCRNKTTNCSRRCHVHD